MQRWILFNTIPIPVVVPAKNYKPVHQAVNMAISTQVFVEIPHINLNIISLRYESKPILRKYALRISAKKRSTAKISIKKLVTLF